MLEQLVDEVFRLVDMESNVGVRYSDLGMQEGDVCGVLANQIENDLLVLEVVRSSV